MQTFSKGLAALIKHCRADVIDPWILKAQFAFLTKKPTAQAMFIARRPVDMAERLADSFWQCGPTATHWRSAGFPCAVEYIATLRTISNMGDRVKARANHDTKLHNPEYDRVVHFLLVCSVCCCLPHVGTSKLSAETGVYWRRVCFLASTVALSVWCKRSRRHTGMG